MDSTPRQRRGAGAKRPRAREEAEDGAAQGALPPTPSSGSRGGSTTKARKTTKSPATGCRFDNSLGLLTRKFLNLLQTSEDGTLDLNKAATELDVQKRRIYDITNVLEGINLIEKQSKNIIVWKGSGLQVSSELQGELDTLRSLKLQLEREESKLNQLMDDMEDSLHSTTQANPAQLYVRHGDVLEQYGKRDTVLAIRGLAGTTLEVPDPDDAANGGERRFEMRLKSARGPIDVFLIQLPDEASIQHFEECDKDGKAKRSDRGSVQEAVPHISGNGDQAAAIAGAAAASSGGAALATYERSPTKLDPAFDFGLGEEGRHVTDLFLAETDFEDELGVLGQPQQTS